LKVPAKVRDALNLLEGTIQELYEGIRAKELQKYEAAEIPFSDINLKEIEDDILREMNRKGGGEKIAQLVRKLAKEVGKICEDFFPF
jgi:bifunctional DNA-binding transcriptional regulator/antitoxin component of YhaV-PrlF toxin-antitoxin module